MCMPKPSGSRGQRRAAAEQERELRISQAIESVKSGRDSWDIAAQKYGVAKGTIYGRACRGRTNRHRAYQDQQTLTLAEEDELVDWLRELDRWGLHVQRRIESVTKRTDHFDSAEHKELPLRCGGAWLLEPPFIPTNNEARKWPWCTAHDYTQFKRLKIK
ncbi:hypothetical protein C8R44DRAFT_740299 [Mycena epipterygia]|nr:hypothetical protein C8R44DRAFT_740299 [Mycena epipterygia]